MIYPIGLSTTWDHAVRTVYDGQDIQEYRQNINTKFNRDFVTDFTVRKPAIPGMQYILILSAATMTVRQLFTASVDESETSQSIWTASFSDLSGKVSGGYLKHVFVHPGGDTETAKWPIVAIPVSIY